MNTPTHIRRFVVPSVRELGLSHGSRDVPPEPRVTRPAQRSLVAALLPRARGSRVMRAYQLVEWQQPPVLRDVPVPEPGPGEVLVKIGGAGACHSDLHVMGWPEGFLPYELPFTLGHENAGWIESFGAGVKGWEVGEVVAIYGPWGCGRCRSCRMGLETLCERAAELGAAGGG